jgi:hypothetical protein
MQHVQHGWRIWLWSWIPVWMGLWISLRVLWRYTGSMRMGIPGKRMYNRCNVLWMGMAR